jgi:hypothetical protein
VSDHVFDLDTPAATAAHDQAVAEALTAIRTCEHFVLVAEMPKGHVMCVSATAHLMLHADYMIMQHLGEILAAEYDAHQEES